MRSSLLTIALAAVAAMAKLDIPDLEAAVSVIQSREAEMTPEEHERFTALAHRVKALMRGATGAVEDHPAALEATDHPAKDHPAAPAPAAEAFDREALSLRLEAIKGKIEKSSDLANDPDVQAALRRVSAKLERAELKAGASEPAMIPKKADAPSREAETPKAAVPAKAAAPTSTLERSERAAMEMTVAHAKTELALLTKEHADDAELMALVDKADGLIQNLEHSGDVTDVPAPAPAPVPDPASPAPIHSVSDVARVIAGAERTLASLEADAGADDEPRLSEVRLQLERIKARQARQSKQQPRQQPHQQGVPVAEEDPAKEKLAGADADTDAHADAEGDAAAREEALRKARSLERELREPTGRAKLRQILPRVQALRARVHADVALAHNAEMVSLLRATTRHLERSLERSQSHADDATGTFGLGRRRTRSLGGTRLRGRVLSEDEA